MSQPTTVLFWPLDCEQALAADIRDQLAVVAGLYSTCRYLCGTIRYYTLQPVLVVNAPDIHDELVVVDLAAFITAVSAIAAIASDAT